MPFVDVYKDQICYRFTVEHKGSIVVNARKAVEEKWGKSLDMPRGAAVAHYRKLLSEGYVRPINNRPWPQPVLLGQHWKRAAIDF